MRGHVREEDGARWITATEFGDDKERVIRPSDGASTYLLMLAAPPTPHAGACPPNHLDRRAKNPAFFKALMILPLLVRLVS